MPHRLFRMRDAASSIWSQSAERDLSVNVTNTSAAQFDVITMGRVGVDLYPNESGVPLAQVAQFHRFLGGSPTNVAVAAARFGRVAAVITKVGAEGFGDFVRTALRSFGVD